MAGGRFYGFAVHRIPPRDGSQISYRQLVVGNKIPDISFAIGMGPMARSSSAGCDQWVFAIDRRRRAPHGKTDLLNDLSARSDGSALTTLLCSGGGIFVICCFRSLIILT